MIEIQRAIEMAENLDGGRPINIRSQEGLLRMKNDTPIIEPVEDFDDFSRSFFLIPEAKIEGVNMFTLVGFPFPYKVHSERHTKVLEEEDLLNVLRAASLDCKDVVQLSTTITEEDNIVYISIVLETTVGYRHIRKPWYSGDRVYRELDWEEDLMGRVPLDQEDSEVNNLEKYTEWIEKQGYR